MSLTWAFDDVWWTRSQSHASHFSLMKRYLGNPTTPQIHNRAISKRISSLVRTKDRVPSTARITKLKLPMGYCNATRLQNITTQHNSFPALRISFCGINEVDTLLLKYTYMASSIMNHLSSRQHDLSSNLPSTVPCAFGCDVHKSNCLK